MSPIGRVFLVLNLILSAAFLGWASNALATTQDYKQKLEDKAREMADTVGLKDSEISQLDIDKRNAEESTRQRREERDSVTADRDRLKSQFDDTSREKDKLLGDVTAIQTTLDGYRSSIDAAVAAKDQAVQQMGEMRDERDAALEAQTMAEEGQRNAEDAQANLERKVADLQESNTSLGQQVSQLDTRLSTLVEVTGTSFEDILTQPKIDAAVLAVRMDLSPGLVMLNVGTEDGVKKGFTFDVYSGNVYKGQVKVVNVQGSMCSALLDRAVSGANIQQGDLASTRML